MARTKGSKNKATLIREMREHGCGETTLDMVDYATLREWHALVMAGQTLPRPASIPKPAPIIEQERIRISVDLAKPMYEATEKRLKEMGEYYGYEDHVPDRISDHLLKLYYAENLDAARDICRQALGKMHSFLLSQWSKRRIQGPATVDNIAKRAKKAEGWVKRFEREKKTEQAEKQRARLESILNTPVATKEPDWFR